jgi:predicted Zn-dependent protease
MQHRHDLLSAAVAAFLFLAASSVDAQVARVSGIVRDVTGEPLRGALVTAETGAGVITATTDDNGRFLIVGMRAGRWKFEVQAPGYHPETGEMSVRSAGVNQPVTIALRRAGLFSSEPLGKVAGADLQEMLTAASALFDEQKWNEAIEAYRAILAKAPSIVAINLQIAAAHRNRKDYPAAIAAYQGLLKSQPANEKAWVGIAMANLESGNSQAAEKVLLQAAETTGGREVFYSLAELQKSEGRAADAANWYQKAASADPSWGKPRYRLGELALAGGDQGRAAKYLGEAIAVDPASPEAELAKAALARLK